MNDLLIPLIQALAPVVLSAIERFQSDHAGVAPTREQLIVELTANADRYLAEGAVWRAAHPPA